jgi:predicted amidohydrolase YtcJ
MLSRRRTLAAFAGLSSLACRRGRGPSPEPSTDTDASELLIRATIYTNDDAAPSAEAMLLRGSTIAALGSFAELDAARGAATPVIDWRDATIIPGLTDAHAHLLGLGQSREIVDLRGVASVAEIVERLREQAPAQGWVLGRGWDQNLWGGAMPTAAALDEAFGERPVWLRRIDGHAGWANTAVLKLAGIDEGTGDPEGGEILRDPSSRAATGVLIDNAMGLVPTPEPSAADLERWLRAATREAASLGLTGVHEMGLGPDAHAVFQALAGAGELPIRVHGYAAEGWWAAGLDGLSRSPITPEARYLLAGVKLYADGALGSRGAALIEPYADRPEHHGALMHPPEQFVALVGAIVEHGLQVATHAIGDLGNRTIVDAYAAALAEHPGDRRLRIEHVQIIDPHDIPRMAKLGVVASMQPTHATSDMPWAPARLGEQRLAGAYAWRRMLDAAVPLAFGSDFPVEQPSPLLGLYAAISRQDLAGEPAGGWLADQRLSMAEAIAAFSSGAAFAAHRDDHLGRLAPGYRADFSCFEGDPFTVEPRELPTLKVRATMVDGELVYEG